MTYEMTAEDRARYEAYCKESKREMLGRVKMAFPLEDMMNSFYTHSTDEKVLRDANLAASAICKLIMTGNPELAQAVCRLVSYVCRTMGPDSGEAMSIAMHDLFEHMEGAPERKDGRWEAIRQLDNSGICLLLAYRAVDAMSFQQTLDDWRERHPEAAARIKSARAQKGELALFADNPLTAKEMTQ